MRKVRDFDSELKVLESKTRSLKERKLRQLGELVSAAGADALDPDLLAGGLLAMVAATDADAKEGWRLRGAAFFQARTRRTMPRADRDEQRAPAGDDPTASA